MALPKRQNPGDEDFGSNREDCIKVYYEDLSVCTSYACLHQLRLFAPVTPVRLTGKFANLESYKSRIWFHVDKSHICQITDTPDHSATRPSTNDNLDQSATNY